MKRSCFGLVLALLAVPPPAAAGPAPVARVRPGPEILHRRPAVAPQLTNAGIWHANPILISGSHAYRDGEFLYQDFLYDDHGAASGETDGGDQRGQDIDGSTTGTYTYPRAPAFANNAADLVELRLKPNKHATAFRVTMNMLAPSTAFTIGIGTTSSRPRAFPFGARVVGPADHFLTVHGTSAAFDRGRLKASVDRSRRQIEVDVPESMWRPGRVVRLTAGTGLWGSNAYLVPQHDADQTHPGGAGRMPNPPAFFNIAFRDSEPHTSDWRDAAQAQALAGGDIGSLHADVDFTKLRRGTNDDSGVPRTGHLDRILSSHFSFGEGVDRSVNTLVGSNSQHFHGDYRGRLQPYALYVPRSVGVRGYGFALLLHSLIYNYNQFQTFKAPYQLANEGAKWLVATPEARGPDVWYFDAAEADVFEVWADVAAHYPLDANRVEITGASMGGYGAYKLATQFPDLFGKAWVLIGPPAEGIWAPPAGQTSVSWTNTYYQLESLRNVPIMIWHGTNDELVPAHGPQLVAHKLDDLGYRYEMDTFPGYDHGALYSRFDSWESALAFLRDSVVETRPAHVTLAVNPLMDEQNFGIRGDHAYWISDVRVRDASVPSCPINDCLDSRPRGFIDARSMGLGRDDAAVGPTRAGVGVEATPYTRVYKSWSDGKSVKPNDTVEIRTTNIRRFVIDAAGAGVTRCASLRITTDGPLDVVLMAPAGVRRVLAARAGTFSVPPSCRARTQVS